jgi:hypothetical protein
MKIDLSPTFPSCILHIPLIYPAWSHIKPLYQRRRRRRRLPLRWSARDADPDAAVDCPCTDPPEGGARCTGGRPADEVHPAPWWPQAPAARRRRHCTGADPVPIWLLSSNLHLPSSHGRGRQEGHDHAAAAAPEASGSLFDGEG